MLVAEGVGDDRGGHLKDVLTDGCRAAGGGRDADVPAVEELDEDALTEAAVEAGRTGDARLR